LFPPDCNFNSGNYLFITRPNHNHRDLSPVNMVDGKALPTPSDSTHQLQHKRFET
ncbi:hypothetical protein L9F63_003756, partial [Diploptera punctata]